jgi:hypothetical protein
MNEFRQLVNHIASTPFERAEREWRDVLRCLALPLFYQPALAVALANCDWRKSKDAGRYLRTVTIRQAERLGLADVKGPIPISEILSGERTHEQVLNGDPGLSHLDESIYDRLDQDLIDGDSWGGIGVNWELVGKRAGLNENEICVLECRADGLTRSEILEEVAEDERARLELQAAYRRVHEHLPEIRAVLLGQPPQKPKRRVRRG